MTATQRIIESKEEAPRIIAPDTLSLFSHRARRFEKLAEGHVLGDWLNFLAALTRAQHAALQSFPAVPLPDAAALRNALTHLMPPLPAESLPRDPAWRTFALPLLLDAAEENAPEQGRSAFRALRNAPVERLEELASQLLGGNPQPADAAVLPVVAAALQVQWTHMAAALGAFALPVLDVPGLCPCCGSLPVASVIRTMGNTSGLRYLHCSLCNTEWNMVRVKCPTCDITEGIVYQHIEGYAPHVRAETCNKGRHYLKIISTDQEADADPVADDLATLALDFLVDEARFTRSGPNLLLVAGPVESSSEGE